jgi:hypothetical protein
MNPITLARNHLPRYNRIQEADSGAAAPLFPTDHFPGH